MSDEQPQYPPPAMPEPREAPPAATMPAPPQPKQPGPFRRGFGLGTGLGLGLAVAAIGLSVVTAGAAVLAGVGALASGAAKPTTATTTVWGTGSGTLRAISIGGTIMTDSSDGSLLASGTYGYEIAEQLDGLSADDASGVVLLVNTPGGSIPGSKAIADAVERYQERTGQKVLVHVGSMSASGGVYATSTADEIVADHGAMVGSIGVIFGPFTQYKDVVATSGSIVESGVTTSGGITSEYLTAGTSKDFGDPFREMTDEEREHYLGLLDNEYQHFVEQVAEGRGIAKDAIINDLGAYLFDADTAIEKGLVDSVMGRDEFFRHAATAAGLDPDDTRVEAIAEPSGLEMLLGATRSSGVAPAATVEPGVAPVLSPSICGGIVPVAITDLSGACG